MLTSLSIGLPTGCRTVRLRLIETTDLHLNLLPWDYYADRPHDGIGLTAAARLIEQARIEVPNALLFDNGDFLQGTPLGDVVARPGGLGGDQLHPAIAAMNALGYDAINLGNHEFNFGLDFLTRALADAACPVVSANLALGLGAGPRDDRLLVRPYALLDRVVIDNHGQPHPIRIGVLGLAPPQVVDWDHHLLAGRLAARDSLEAARAWLPELRAAGADVVVVLAHTGIGPARHTEGMENFAIPLARLSGIDAMMMGHNHLVYPAPAFTGWPDLDPATGTIAGVPAVMAGCFGSHIGLIDLLLTPEGGGWTVLGAHTSVRSVAALAAQPGAQGADSGEPPAAAPTGTGAVLGPDGRLAAAPGSAGPADAAIGGAESLRPAERVAAAVAPAHRRTLAAVRRPIGRGIRPMHSYFAHLGGTDALALVAQAKAAHVAARLEDPALRALPLLASVTPFKSGGLAGPQGYTDIPAGPLALRHIADLYPFPNAIAAVVMTGAEVLEWLERAAAAFNRVAPGSTGTPLRNPAVAGHHFEVVEPLRVIYDLTQPSRYDGQGQLVRADARRVVEARLDGAPIDPATDYLMCTNSYRLGGAGGYLSPGTARVALSTGTIIRDILRDHVAGQSVVRTRAGGRLGFAPIPRTTALFETGPGAMHHLDEIAAYRPEPRGMTYSGFLRLRIDLSGPGSG